MTVELPGVWAACLDVLPVAIIALDPQGDIRFTNGEARRLLGDTSELRAGQPIDAIAVVEPDGIASILRPDGAVVRFRADRKVIELDGKPTTLLVAEAAGQGLQHEENSLAQPLAAEELERLARLGTWRYDPLTGECRWSKGLYRLMGLSGATRPSLGALLMGVHPEDRLRVEQAIAATVEQRRPLRLHYRIDPGGTDRVLLTRGEWSEGDRAVIATTEDVTARRRKRLALRDAERRTRLILQTSPDGFFVAGHDGRIREANDTYCHMVGYSRGELVGMALSDLVESPSGDIMDILHSVARNGSACFELPHRRREGGRIDLEATIRLAQTGQDSFIFGFLRDVTERKRAEAILLRHAAEFRHAMDAMADGACIIGDDDRIGRANRSFLEMTGLTAAEVIGRPAHSIFHHPDLNAACPICVARREQRDSSVTMEPEHPCNRTGRPMELTVRAMRSDRGDAIGTLVTLHDLSRSRQADAELDRLNQQVLSLLNSAGEGVVGIDSDGLCTFINSAALEMLGYGEEELKGRNIHALIHHSHEDGSFYPLGDCPMYQAVKKAKATRKASEVLWRKDGTAVPVDYSAHPVVENGMVSGAVVVFRDVAEERALARKMDYLATHDPLTGLLNRRVFELRVNRAITAARITGRTDVLCYVDLDQFKVINDTCGHAAGDELLRQVAGLLHGQLSEGDSLGRLGGDEFGILLENTRPEEVMPRIHALQETIRGLRFAWEDKTFVLAASIGVVTISAETVSLASALSAADTACFVAKDGGRNRVHVHENGDIELARKRGEMQWVSRIHEALDLERFVLRYQPIVPLNGTGEPGDRYEILVSMRDGDGQLVPPGAFIPAAERFNLMPALDRWVMQTTLAWLAEHPGQLQRLAWCTINLSGTTLGDHGFLASVVRQLRETGVPPEKVCFEITETAAVANLSRAVGFIRRLSALGCRFALDDFGSGMSSFAYLRKLPVDFLKIDGNFVREIVGDPIDRAMVEAIHQVGNVMNIRTIAEHLESSDIMRVLQEIGIDYGQGYRLGRPRLLDTLIAPEPVRAGRR